MIQESVSDLCRACVVGDVARVSDLVTRHRSALNATDSEGFSPLLLSTSYNMVGAVRVLVAHKASVNQFDRAGKCSPLLLAAQCGHGEVRTQLPGV
jgi:ankyrin repeat protein